MFRFTIRELVLLTLVVAMGVGRGLVALPLPLECSPQWTTNSLGEFLP
jgi:hypothetical protein